MEFDWDAAKSNKNKAKHGIDFDAAKDLWFDQGRIEIHAPHPVEKRSILIAKFHGKLWTAVYTMRGNTVRIISIRRSREKEAELYEKQQIG